MWLFALFDLPTKNKKHRRAYTRFRRKLLEDGFQMLQYSVYARYCESETASEAHRNRIKLYMPDKGQVRLMAITDRQFGKMDVYHGKNAVDPEQKPKQTLLF